MIRVDRHIVMHLPMEHYNDNMFAISSGTKYHVTPFPVTTFLDNLMSGYCTNDTERKSGELSYCSSASWCSHISIITVKFHRQKKIHCLLSIAHTEITFKPSSFLMVNTAYLHDQHYPISKYALGNISPSQRTSYWNDYRLRPRNF